MKINTTLIKQLLNSDLTSYHIAKQTGLAISMIDRYRSGDNYIENITLSARFHFLANESCFFHQKRSPINSVIPLSLLSIRHFTDCS